MTDFAKEDWKKTKKQFVVGIILSSIIITIFLLWPESKITKNDFVEERNNVIETKPLFKKERYGKSTKYLVEVHFKNNRITYEISGIDYNYLRNEDFEKDINIGDTVSIYRFKNEIKSISKNGEEYLDYPRAEENRTNTNKFVGLLFMPIFFLCFVPQFFERKPSIRIGDKNYEIQFEIIAIIVFIITFLILKFNIEFEFITNGEFIKY